MKKYLTFVMALGLVGALASCSDKTENPEGKWTSAAPQSVTEKIAGATSATETLTFNFAQAASGEATAPLTLTAVYDVTVPASANDSTASASYQATATINGTWTRDVDEQDDFVLTFDRNSLNVTATDAPELGPVTDAFLGSLARFTSIEDVEVSKDGKHLKFETDNPDMKYRLVRQ